MSAAVQAIQAEPADADFARELDSLVRDASVLTATAALLHGGELRLLTLKLAAMMATAVAYEFDDLKRARMILHLEDVTPRLIATARGHALQFEAKSAGALQ